MEAISGFLNDLEDSPQDHQSLFMSWFRETNLV